MRSEHTTPALLSIAASILIAACIIAFPDAVLDPAAFEHLLVPTFATAVGVVVPIFAIPLLAGGLLRLVAWLVVRRRADRERVAS